MDIKTSLSPSYSIVVPLHILPTIKSLSEFCYSNHSSNIDTTINPLWFHLFNFVAFNMSIRPLPFRQQVQDLKLFMLVSNIANKLVLVNRDHQGTTRNLMPLNTYYQIIANYFDYFLKESNDSSFYNNEENCNSLIDLFMFLPHIENVLLVDVAVIAQKSVMVFQNEVKKNIDLYELKNHDKLRFYMSFLGSNEYDIEGCYKKSKKREEMVLNDKVNDNQVKKDDIKEDKVNAPKRIIITKQNINETQMNYFKSTSSSFTQTKPSTPSSDHDNNYTIITPNQQEKQSSIEPKVTFRKLIMEQSNQSTPIKSSIKTISDLFNERNNEHIITANYFGTNFFFDNYYHLYFIGSNTFGLNASNSHLDFVILSASITSKVFISNIIKWLTYQPINNLRFSLSTKKSIYNKTALYFNVKSTTQEYNATINIGKDKYLTCNSLLQLYFPKGSTFSKLHIFFSPIVKLYCGAQLAFFILAFFDHKYNIFDSYKIYEKCSFPRKENENMITLSYEDFYYYKLIKGNYDKASLISFEVLVKQFLKFYYMTYKQSLNGNYSKGLKETLDKKYLFSIWRINDDFRKVKMDYYWKKIESSKCLLQNNHFQSYQALVNYFK